MVKTYKVFISHSWDYVDDLMNLRRLLNNRPYFNAIYEEVPPHESINSTNASYIKSKIRQRLEESDVVIGMARVYGSYSEWMQWEIETAKTIGKPIIAVIPWGQERVSSIIAGQANKIVRWNTESIVSAIRELA